MDKHNLFFSHSFAEVSVQYFIYKKSSIVQKKSINRKRRSVMLVFDAYKNNLDH